MDNLIETVDRVLARNTPLCEYCDGHATRMSSSHFVCEDCFAVCRQIDDMTWAEYRGEVN